MREKGSETASVGTTNATTSANKDGAGIGISRDATALVCDIPPVEASSSVSSSFIPGRVPSTQTTPAQAKLGSGSRRGVATCKLLTLEKRPSSPSERARKSIRSVDHEGDSAMPPPLTLDDGRLRLENGSETLEPLPADGDEDRLQVPQMPPKASMDHLRKAALAAVSLSAEEDAAVAGNESIALTAMANRRLSPFTGIASSYSPPLSSSPSSCQSDPSPSSPCLSLSGNGGEIPDVDAAGPSQIDEAGTPIGAPHVDATRAPTEASPSTSKPAGVSSSVRAAIAKSPTRAATLPNIASESAERESDSSFSADDGEVDEMSVTPQQRSELQGRMGDNSLAQVKNSPFGVGKVRANKTVVTYS